MTTSTDTVGGLKTKTTSYDVNNGTRSVANDELSCGSCVRLLKEILEQPESRPRILLQGLMGKYYSNNKNSINTAESSEGTTSGGINPSCTFRSMSDGVEVLIPMEAPPKLKPRRWSELTIPKEQTLKKSIATKKQFSPLLQPQAQMATSPRKSGDIDENLLLSSTEAIEKREKGGPKHLESIKILCRPCSDVGPEAHARAVIIGPTPLSIVACTNRLQENKEEIEQILTHELVHAYDIQQLQLDFTDCESMAYSEVRAAREAECHKQNWLFMKEICIKQKAIAATNNLFPQRGRTCVSKVFQTGMTDKRPFKK